MHTLHITMHFTPFTPPVHSFPTVRAQTRIIDYGTYLIVMLPKITSFEQNRSNKLRSNEMVRTKCVRTKWSEANANYNP
jgi:hypothetical protein